MDGSKALGLSVDEEFNMMRCLTHPSFVRWYNIFDLMPSLRCKAILMDMCDGNCHSLICDHVADIWGRGCRHSSEDTGKIPPPTSVALLA